MKINSINNSPAFEAVYISPNKLAEFAKKGKSPEIDAFIKRQADNLFDIHMDDKGVVTIKDIIRKSKTFRVHAGYGTINKSKLGVFSISYPGKLPEEYDIFYNHKIACKDFDTKAKKLGSYELMAAEEIANNKQQLNEIV